MGWIGGASGEIGDPFRELFPSPVRYYINDFELSVTFGPLSPPSSRVIVGFPTKGVREGEYGREPAPEMRSGLSYCPFRADIWQLGYTFKWYFGVCIMSHAPRLPFYVVLADS
jgi:hypothetical protein